MEQSNDVAYAYVFNSCLLPAEFLQYIARDFGLSASGKNKGEILFDLSKYVIERGVKKADTLLVVDEAHHVSADILEEIRLLTNLETAQEKLLQVLLVGQPELNDKLDSAALRQLKQRIAHRSHLAPLNLDETRGYIERRLQLAGASSSGCLSVSSGSHRSSLSSLPWHSPADQYYLRKRTDHSLRSAEAKRHS